jgi:hypothetical protein
MHVWRIRRESRKRAGSLSLREHQPLLAAHLEFARQTVARISIVAAALVADARPFDVAIPFAVHGRIIPSSVRHRSSGYAARRSRSSRASQPLMRFQLAKLWLTISRRFR